MPAHKNPNKRSEHLSIPLNKDEMDDLERIAAAWGRKKTDFARELLFNTLRGLPPPAQMQPLPKAV